MILLITGPKEGGKSTFSKYLESKSNSIITAIADPIYDIVESLKGDTIDRANKTPEERQMLQIIGQSARDYFGEDIWVKKWLQKYIVHSTNYHIIVEDIRYDNEIEYIADRLPDVVVLEVINRTKYTQEHESEMGVGEDLIDLQINNSGSLHDLKFKADKIVEEYLG